MAKEKVQTRGDYYNLNGKVLARSGKKKIATLREKVEKIAEPWYEVDQNVVAAAEAAQAALDELAKRMDEAADYLNEPME